MVETEIVECPNCEGDGHLSYDLPEVVDDGVMHRSVGCYECGWAGYEEWVIESVTTLEDGE